MENKYPKPLYQVGDAVWFVDDGKAQFELITGVSIAKYPYDSKAPYQIRYRVGETSRHDLGFFRKEETLFTTKEDLIKSL